MRLEEFARTVLFGNTLEDKLIALGEPEAAAPGPARAIEVPSFPGRPKALRRVGKAPFPTERELAQDSARGRVLHFFANHELLALELMALVLLRFPEAPETFRVGIARTIAEEQDHLRLYLGRMRELGVGFGELPVSEYFWNCMKDMASPLQFVVQMSLTLEQANLDFSLQYRDACARAGDEKTAAILERVYREEIGHVKHGLHWFNRWRAAPSGSAESEDDWDSYLRLLPPPMTPRRARGVLFAAEGRRQAGLSERFIRELEIHSGSKGRPPAFWLYNPHCDAEIARGKPGLSPSASARRLASDLEHLPMYLARETDIVLVRELPGAAWVKSRLELGFAAPEFRLQEPAGAMPRETHVAGLEPWGWSPESFERFRPWRDRLTRADGANGAWASGMLGQADFAATGLSKLFSKAWSTTFFRQWLAEHPEDEPFFGGPSDAGETFTGWESARAAILGAPEGSLLAKAPWATSGAGNRRILRHAELDGPLGGWIRNTILTQGAIVLEPWLAKEADLSLQLEIGRDAIRPLGARRFAVGSRLEYRGAWLDPRLSSLGTEWLRFLHSPQAPHPPHPVPAPEGSNAPRTPLSRWESLARALGRRLRDEGYQGSAGIDALLWRTARGEPRLKPLVELNPRWTMGRVALALEERILPGTPATWVFVPIRELGARGHSGAESFARALENAHPPRRERSGGSPRLSEGVVFTTDPSRAREVLTLLAIGEKATASVPFTPSHP